MNRHCGQLEKEERAARGAGPRTLGARWAVPLRSLKGTLVRRREAAGRASVLSAQLSDRQKLALNAASREQALPGPPRKEGQQARRKPPDPDAGLAPQRFTIFLPLLKFGFDKLNSSHAFSVSSVFLRPHSSHSASQLVRIVLELKVSSRYSESSINLPLYESISKVTPTKRKNADMRKSI